VTINWTSVPGYLGALTDSSSLIEADVAYRGELIFDTDQQGDHISVELDTALRGVAGWPPFPEAPPEGTERRWDVALSPAVPVELSLDVGSGACSFDLAELHVEALDIDGGSGSMELSLPSSHSFEVSIDGGSGAMDVIVPRNLGVEVDLDSGSGSFYPGRRFQLVSGERGGDGFWETEDLDSAGHVVRLKIDQGSGSIRIE
jgi:hypothetical protein